MSKLTDLIDGAGEGALPSQRYVAAALASSDSGWTSEAVSPLRAEGVERALMALGAPNVLRVHADELTVATIDGAAVRVLEGSYRGHPVHVADTPAGRELLQALAVLGEESPDANAAARLHVLVEALRRAREDEASGEPIEARLGYERLEAVLDATAAAKPLVGGRDVPTCAPDARVCAMLDPDGGAAVTWAEPGAVGFIVNRSGRPAMAAVFTGEAPVLRAARWLVARVDDAAELGPATRAAAIALGEGLEVLVTERVAASLRAGLEERGQQVREGAVDGALVAVALDDEGQLAAEAHPSLTRALVLVDPVR